MYVFYKTTSVRQLHYCVYICLLNLCVELTPSLVFMLHYIQKTNLDIQKDNKWKEHHLTNLFKEFFVFMSVQKF